VLVKPCAQVAGRSIFRLRRAWLRRPRLAIARLSVDGSGVVRVSKMRVVLTGTGIALARVRSRGVEIVPPHSGLRIHWRPLRTGVVAKWRSRRPLIGLARLRSIRRILLTWSWLILRPPALGPRILWLRLRARRRVVRRGVLRLGVMWRRRGVGVVRPLAEGPRKGQTQRHQPSRDQNRQPRSL
jgi:hypothetical protein